MTDQTALIASIRETLEGRLEAISTLPAIGWVLGLPTTPAYFVEGSKTLTGLENATIHSEPRGAWNVRNGAGELLVWSPIHKASKFARESIEKALDQLDDMFEFAD